MPGTCIGSACCSTNQTYDASSNLCVDSTTTTTTESFTNNTNVLTEAMINSVLTKTSGKLKPDYTMNAESRIKPRNAESFINFKM